MKKTEFIIACLMLHSSLACIAIHFLAFMRSREPWARAKAGIIREFRKPFRIY